MDTYQTLLNASFRFLSFRPRSFKEIGDFLHKKTRKAYVAPEVFKRITDRLTELGYIDDAKFTAWWIESRQKTKPKGMRLIKRELKKKGIETEAIEEMPEDDFARRAIQKKIEIWKRLPKLEQKKKIYDFLGMRGFSFDTIRRVIDSAVGIGYNTFEAE
jgi:regulatory protein